MVAWCCQACTFENIHNDFLTCELCHTPRDEPSCAAPVHDVEEGVNSLVRGSSNSLSPAQRIKRFWRRASGKSDSASSPTSSGREEGAEKPIDEDWLEVGLDLIDPSMKPAAAAGSSLGAAHLEAGSGSSLISSDHLLILSRYLPRQVRERAWRLIYSLSTDGTSLETLLERSSRTAEPCVMLISGK